MKKLKPIIIILLTFTLSFSALSSIRVKKADASMTALIGAGVATGAFTAFASYMVASGYHMQISDMLIYFTNTFYDKVEDHYIAKAGKVSEIEKLTYTTLGFLSGNNPLDETALQTEMNDLIRANAPAPFMENYLPDPNTAFLNIFTGYYDTQTIDYYKLDLSRFAGYYDSTVLNGKPHYYFKSQYLNSIFKLTFTDGPYINKTVYISPTNQVVTYSNNSRSGVLYKVVSQDNSVAYGVLAPYNGFKFIQTGLQTMFGYNGYDNLKDIFTVGTPFIPVANPVEYIPDSPAADPTKNIKAVAPNWYDLVSGIAKTPQGILDRMDQDSALQQAILDRLSALEYGKDEPIAIPIIDPITGETIYNTDVPPSTDSDRLWGIGNIANKIYQAIKDLPITVKNMYNSILQFPEDIANKVGSLWNDVINPSLTQFWDSTKQTIIDIKDGIWGLADSLGTSISDTWNDVINPSLNEFWDSLTTKVTDIYNQLVAVPGLIADAFENVGQDIIDWFEWVFVPSEYAIEETWQPLYELYDFKISPLIQPFQDMTFYEKEYEDIYVTLKFGNITNRYKIIDYQYLKSVRNDVKSIIRAFFWILIVFFNINQLYKLIRNSQLLPNEVWKEMVRNSK